MQRVTGKMKYTHDGFGSDTYHTYETFKVEISPPKKKVEEAKEVEAVKEGAPSPETSSQMERKKLFSVKVSKTNDLQR